MARKGVSQSRNFSYEVTTTASDYFLMASAYLDKGDVIMFELLYFDGFYGYAELDPYDVCRSIVAKGCDCGFDCWCMVHDRDLNDDGTPKRTHFHCVIRFLSRRTFMSALDWFWKNLLPIPKERIQMHMVYGSEDKEYSNLALAVRYLAHKGWQNKFQYSPELVMTNDLDYWNSVISIVKIRADLDAGTLIAVVAESNCVSDILLKLGLEAFKKYQGAIMSLWREKTSLTAFNGDFGGISDVKRKA